MTRRVWFDACTNVAPPVQDAIQSNTGVDPCETENESVRSDTQWALDSLTGYIENVQRILLSTPHKLSSFSAKSVKEQNIELVREYQSRLSSTLAERARRANPGKDLEDQPTYFSESNFVVSFATDAKNLIQKAKKP